VIAAPFYSFMVQVATGLPANRLLNPARINTFDCHWQLHLIAAQNLRSFFSVSKRNDYVSPKNSFLRIGACNVLQRAQHDASPGSGSVDVIYDSTTHTLALQVTFSGLLGPTTASHIHATTASPGTGNAGVATTVPNFVGFPLGVFSGILDLTLLSSYNPAFVTANGGTADSAETALISFHGVAPCFGGWSIDFVFAAQSNENTKTLNPVRCGGSQAFRSS
jgi:hypothetical protein